MNVYKFAVCVLLTACAPSKQQEEHLGIVSTPEVIGQFVDDYDNEFRVSAVLFEQLPQSRFHIVEWNEAERYFVARNDPKNPSDPGRWTRIDWMLLEGVSPYTWGFCMTAYRAASREEARATPPPNRATPRTGCNGFPFSRMRRAQ